MTASEEASRLWCVWGRACNQISESVGTSHAPGPGNHPIVSHRYLSRHVLKRNAHARVFEGARHIDGETVPVLGTVTSSPALHARTKHDDQEGDRVRLRRSNDDDEDG